MQLENKKVIIDERMRQIEKDKIKELGYNIIEIHKSEILYSEISSHVDIFTCKVGNKIIIEPTQYEHMLNKSFIKGSEKVGSKYPLDIKYNVCIIGKKAIHNFQYTDKKLKEYLIENKFELINTTQGYTNCSIAVIDDNSAIVTDKGLNKILKAHGIDTLFVEDELDIKLLEGNNYSKRKGFIGGCISRVGDNIIVFGDLNLIDKDAQIRDFISGKGNNIIEFAGLDVVDYGGMLVI